MTFLLASMFNLLATADADGVQTLLDGLASNDLVLMIAGLVVLIAAVVLKALGKSIPLLDTVLSLALKTLKSLRTKTVAEKRVVVAAEGAEAVKTDPAKGLTEITKVEKI